MKDSPQTGKPDDGQNEEIVYEEIVRPPFPTGGAPRPPFGRFAPPPPAFVIEEEIIEEFDDASEPTPESAAEKAEPPPVSAPERPEIRRAPKPPNPKPFRAVNPPPFKHAASSKAADGRENRYGGAEKSKFVRLALAAAVFAGLCIGIFYAFKSNPYAASILSPEDAEARPRESAGMVLRFSSDEMTEAAKKFYSKLSNPLTLENLRDIIITGSITMSGGQPKNFYCIKRYDSGAFLKIGSGDDENTYLLPAGGGAFLLEEGRTGGRKTALDAERAALLRALTEWDEAIFPSAFASDIPEGRGKPEFKFLGNREFFGKKVEAAEAVFEGGDRTTFFFDAESGLLSGISFPANGSEMRVAFSDYGDADGVYKFPMTRAVFLGDRKIAELDVSFASVNRGLFFPM